MMTSIGSHAKVISLDALGKTYRTRPGSVIHALDSLTLTVPRGQVIGILGPSSAGKSTLINLLSGRLRPTTGRVIINGYDAMRHPSLAAAQVGVAPLWTHTNTRHSIWEMLMAGEQASHVQCEGFTACAEKMLRAMRLWERRKDAVSTLSSGARQLLGVACALGSNRPVMALDEPLLGLNLAAHQIMVHWIHTLARDLGTTVMIATQHIDQIEELCQRVAILQNGQLIADLPVDELNNWRTTTTYQIRVRGHLDQSWKAWFDNLTVTAEPGGSTLISGIVADQAALHGLLLKVSNLGLPLLSVTPSEPDYLAMEK